MPCLNNNSLKECFIFKVVLVKRPSTGSNEQMKSNRTGEATGDSSVVQNSWTKQKLSQKNIEHATQ